jgi:hypothetical protein
LATRSIGVPLCSIQRCGTARSGRQALASGSLNSLFCAEIDVTV